MLSKQYSLSVKYSFVFGISGLALVLSSLLRLIFGSTFSNLSLAFSLIGMIFAILGSKMHFESGDEMSNHHLLLASYRSLRNVILLLILSSIGVKALEVAHRFFKYPLITIQFDGNIIFLLLGTIFMSLGYYFIRYEKYGEEE